MKTGILTAIDRYGLPLVLAVYLLFRLDGIIVDMRDSLRYLSWTQARMDCLIETHSRGLVAACPSLLEGMKK
jgi:hypothetical protein